MKIDTNINNSTQKENKDKKEPSPKKEKEKDKKNPKAQKTKEESIKKLVDINNKLEGGGKNKLMSFMQNEKDNNTLEEFSKKANEKNKESEKSEKPKRVKNSLRKLRGMDI